MYAYMVELTSSDSISKPQYLGRGLGLVLLAFFGMLVGTIISISIPFPTEYSSLAGQIIISQGIGLLGVSLAYIHYTDATLDFFEFNIEPPRDIGLALGVALGLLGMSMLTSLITFAFGIETAENTVTPILESSMMNVYVFIVLSMLVVGPLEELFFRGTVQRYLKQGFSTNYAVGIAAVLFAGMHLMSMGGGVGAVGYLAYLAMLFGGGLLLGYSYEYTNNLLVPMVGHGLYNALLGVSLLF